MKRRGLLIGAAALFLSAPAAIPAITVSGSLTDRTVNLQNGEYQITFLPGATATTYTITGDSSTPDTNTIEYIVCDNDSDIALITEGNVKYVRTIAATGEARSRSATPLSWTTTSAAWAKARSSDSPSTPRSP